MNNTMKLIKNSQQGDNKSLILLIEKFEPLLNKYAKKSSSPDDMKSILTLHLIESIKKMKCINESSSICFITTIMKNKYIYEIKKEQHQNITELSYNYLNEFDSIDTYSDKHLLIFENMIKNLSHKKRKIIILKFVYGYSDQEIALKLHISRQAVNKHLRQSYSLLKDVISLQ